MSERVIEVGKVYRHFKGNFYYNKEIVKSSETKEDFVVYQALYGEYKTWIRPLKMFLEEADVNRVDNVTHQKYRFELVDIREEIEKYGRY